MLDLQDEDPPEFVKAVNRQVTLDMLTDEELVQELIARERLLVVTARRQVPRDTFIKENFYPAIQALLSCALAKVLVSDNLIGEDLIQLKDDLEFHSTIVVLRTTEEEIPI